MAVETQDRWTEIRGIHKQYRTLYDVLGGFTGIALLVFIGFMVFAQDQLGFAANVYTETISAIASIIVTVLILDKHAEQREERRRIADLQARLVREAGSPVNSVAVQAVNELRNHGWLEGEEGLLAGADLDGADLSGADMMWVNLSGAHLFEANLAGINLSGANLVGADLRRANLEGTRLINVNLERAILSSTNLSGANLPKANLTKAHMTRANLDGAYLGGANLAGAHAPRAFFTGANLYLTNLTSADLTGAKFDEKTLLPNGEDVGLDENVNSIFSPDSYYKPGVTDMHKYTDPDHPDFWQPEWVKEQQAGADDAGES